MTHRALARWLATPIVVLGLLAAAPVAQAGATTDLAPLQSALDETVARLVRERGSVAEGARSAHEAAIRTLLGHRSRLATLAAAYDEGISRFEADAARVLRLRHEYDTAVHEHGRAIEALERDLRPVASDAVSLGNRIAQHNAAAGSVRTAADAVAYDARARSLETERATLQRRHADLVARHSAIITRVGQRASGLERDFVLARATALRGLARLEQEHATLASSARAAAEAAGRGDLVGVRTTVSDLDVAVVTRDGAYERRAPSLRPVDGPSSAAPSPVPGR